MIAFPSACNHFLTTAGRIPSCGHGEKIEVSFGCIL